MIEKQVKNKEQTMTRLLTAVEDILANEGYQGLGINPIAKQAGVSKALIYRYFGGLEGLIDAYGETDSFWPTTEEIRGMAKEDFRKLNLRERCKHIFRNFRQALAKRPHTVAIFAWELTEKNSATKNLIARRTTTSLDVVKQMLGGHKLVYSPYDKEMIALLGAALLHLTIREHSHSPFAGMALDEGETWDRIEGALDVIFSGLEAAYEMNQVKKNKQ